MQESGEDEHSFGSLGTIESHDEEMKLKSQRTQEKNTKYIAAGLFRHIEEIRTLTTLRCSIERCFLQYLKKFICSSGRNETMKSDYGG